MVELEAGWGRVPACLPACRELCVAAASGPGLADMFGRIMVSLDEDIVSLDIPRWVAAATGGIAQRQQ